MRYLKALGLVLLAMVVGAGGASASLLTQGPYTGTVKAESTNLSIDGSINIACGKTNLEWGVNSHGASAPISGPISSLAFTECGKDTVSVLNLGRLKLHATSGGNGTMTWDGTLITVQLHRIVLGFPVTTHCIYSSDETDIGTFTGSNTTFGTAKLHIGAVPLPEVITDSACGEDAVLTGSYEFTHPDYLRADT